MPNWTERSEKVESHIEAMGVVPQPPAKAKPRELVWKCQQCEAHNPATVYRCANCGAPR